MQRWSIRNPLWVSSSIYRSWVQEDASPPSAEVIRLLKLTWIDVGHPAIASSSNESLQWIYYYQSKCQRVNKSNCWDLFPWNVWMKMSSLPQLHRLGSTWLELCVDWLQPTGFSSGRILGMATLDRSQFLVLHQVNHKVSRQILSSSNGECVGRGCGLCSYGIGLNFKWATLSLAGRLLRWTRTSNNWRPIFAPSHFMTLHLCNPVYVSLDGMKDGRLRIAAKLTFVRVRHSVILSGGTSIDQQPDIFIKFVWDDL